MAVLTQRMTSQWPIHYSLLSIILKFLMYRSRSTLTAIAYLLVPSRHSFFHLRPKWPFGGVPGSVRVVKTMRGNIVLRGHRVWLSVILSWRGLYRSDTLGKACNVCLPSLKSYIGLLCLPIRHSVYPSHKNSAHYTFDLPIRHSVYPSHQKICPLHIQSVYHTFNLSITQSSVPSQIQYVNHTHSVCPLHICLFIARSICPPHIYQSFNLHNTHSVLSKVPDGPKKINTPKTRYVD